ncbi:pilus assembly protein [Bosea beijingensis]|uniref:pilus assembly protein n=1 Tax=Bosea beijingensis TaxID=3068632 RepID=UPI0027420131|nr:pilus assembly protein [Bosea sp. REN20]
MMKIGSLPELIRRFRRDEGGNFLMLFGLTLIPLMGVVGVAIDYSRASNARQALSAAIDSAALMAARDAQKLTDGQLKSRIDAWVLENLPPDVKKEFTGVTVAIDRTARTIKIDAKAVVPTTISSVLGVNQLPVGTNSQSTWGTNKIELALVLDNTGSMANSNKMTNLKTASKSLLKIMKDAAITTDQIRVSIVPFNTQVRIARTFKDEAWMRYGLTRNVTCSSNKQNCYVNNTDIYVYDTGNLTCDSRGRTCSYNTITKANWSVAGQGCITDRNQDYDTKDGGSAATAEQYPAFWCSQTSLAEIMPLSSDWTALGARVDAMTSAGNTNVTIGAVWGWATLTPSVPFTEAKPATEPNLKKYMILLTDGDNTENRFTATGNDIDARTKAACANAKATGINIYTIRVIDGDADLLRGCASNPGMYYDVQNAAQLDPIFKAIANEISAVRLTQ